MSTKKYTPLVKKYLLFLVVFTLPMYTVVNNILLGLYVVTCILEGGYKSKWKVLNTNFIWTIPLFVFFILAIIGSIVNYDGHFFKHIEKYWSYILIPIVFLGQKGFYVKNKDNVFIGLLWGTVITLILCYSNVLYEMYSKSEPFSYLFRWRHLNHRFTEFADTHPAYLGLFITIATAYLLLNYKIKSIYKLIILVFFSIGMFQLASRMAMLIFILSSLVVLILKYRQKAVLFLLILSFIGTIFVLNASDYLYDRMFSSNQIENDNRFDRLLPSYEIFKENYLLGIGFSKIDEVRNLKYQEYGYNIAYENNYNSHNQLMEYLAINGILGGLVYVLVFIFLIYMSIKQRDFLFLILFICFLMANVTESMLVRIKGIEFFVIFATLYLSKFATVPHDRTL